MAVPLSVPLPGLAPIAIVTLAVDKAFVLPAASWIATLTPVAPPIVLFATVFVGWAVNASLFGAPALTTCASGSLTDEPGVNPDPPPLKHALMEWVPVDRLEVVNVAVRVLPLPVKVVVEPRFVPPLQLLFALSAKSTAWPLNVHVLLHVIVAVKVTDWPACDGLRLDWRVVIVEMASVKLVVAVPELAPVALTL